MREAIGAVVGYNYWANHRLLEAVAAQGPEAFTQEIGREFSFPTLQSMLVHVMGAELIWLGRWQGDSPGTPLRAEGYPTLAALRVRWQRAEDDFRRFVDGLGDEGLARVVETRTLAGETFRLPLWQMIQHVVNHGTHHRSEAATMLTRLGTPPPPLDLVVYYRS
jgi:uncharacterized damage-inducible protein DinB